MARWQCSAAGPHAASWQLLTVVWCSMTTRARMGVARCQNCNAAHFRREDSLPRVRGVGLCDRICSELLRCWGLGLAPRISQLRALPLRLPRFVV